MKSWGLALCLLTAAAGARAEDWTPYHLIEGQVGAASLRTASLLDQDRALEAEGGAVVKVTDDSTWARLLHRALTRPTRVQRTLAGGTEFTVYIVQDDKPLLGQDCPAGTSPQNALYVSKPADGASKLLYPVRITAVCKGSYELRDSFSVSADSDGTILDLTLYDGSLGIAVHPLQEPATGASSAEAASLQQFLGRLVRQFIEAP